MCLVLTVVETATNTSFTLDDEMLLHFSGNCSTILANILSNLLETFSLFQSGLDFYPV